MERARKLFACAAAYLVSAVLSGGLKAAEVIYNNDVLFIKGITGTGSVLLMENNSSLFLPSVVLDTPLYKYTLRQNGFKLYADITRETDYQRVFGPVDSRGGFLNSLRAAGRESNLLRALDSSESYAGMEKAMTGSAVFNPILLMNPARMWVRTGVGRSAHAPFDGGDGGAGVIFNNSLTMAAAAAGADFSSGKFHAYIGAHKGVFHQDDFINNFSGNFYGAKLSANYKIENIFFASELNYTRAEFSDALVYQHSGGDIAGDAWFWNIDAGYDFKAGDFKIAPVVRARYELAQILNDSDSGIAGAAGARIKHETKISDIETKYSLFGLVDSVYQELGVSAEHHFGVDKTCVNLLVSAIRQDSVVYYKFALGGKVSF